VCPQGIKIAYLPTVKSSVQTGHVGHSNYPLFPFLQCFSSIFIIGSLSTLCLAAGRLSASYALKLASCILRTRSSKKFEDLKF